MGDLKARTSQLQRAVRGRPWFPWSTLEQCFQAWGREQQHHLGAYEWCKLWGPAQDLLTWKLHWSGPANCVITSFTPPGDSEALIIHFCKFFQSNLSLLQRDPVGLQSGVSIFLGVREDVWWSSKRTKFQSLNFNIFFSLKLIHLRNYPWWE